MFLHIDISNLDNSDAVMVPVMVFKVAKSYAIFDQEGPRKRTGMLINVYVMSNRAKLSAY